MGENKFRCNDFNSLFLYVKGKDHTSLTVLLEQRAIDMGQPVPLFSTGAQFLIEVFDWVSQNPVQVTAICTVLVELIRRHPQASLSYTAPDGSKTELTNIRTKDAISLEKELRDARTRSIQIDLSEVKPNDEKTRDGIEHSV